MMTFANTRSEAFWELRELLANGEIALPKDDQLFEELLALRWRPDAKDRVQLEAKQDMKARLGRSPDRADSLAMTFHRDSAGRMSAEGMITKW